MLNSTDISKKHTASIFRVQEVKQDTNVKARGKLLTCFHASVLFTLPTASILLPCSAYLELYMEAICSSKTSDDFLLTTWHYIPENIRKHDNIYYKFK
jgi:hypothetical protein